MNYNIYLYTPWCEQGLSYDAKAIEQIAIQNNIQPIISFEKKRKIIWPCKFEKTKNIKNLIKKNDIFFCFERIPLNYIKQISNETENIYLMINYEYYDRDLIPYYKLFKKVFCKSKYAYERCKNDGLDNIIYMPWILWNFPIARVTNLNKKIKIIFNGGTGGYKDRRNLESIINLFKDYKNDDVELTIKLTDNLRRWTKKILNKNYSFIKNDDRITLIQQMMNRNEYIDFLKNFDINLCPSKFEGFGLTLLEGLHSRLASITINQSPMNEIIIHNENGICIESEVIDKIRHQNICNIDREDFFNQFKKLISNPERIMQMKENTVIKIKKNQILFNSFFKNEFNINNT